MNGVKLEDVDPWAFECVRHELRLHAEVCSSEQCPELANRLRRSLDDATVFRRCGCGEARCRTYALAQRMPDNVQTLSFEHYAGWDAFNILHDGKWILDVEILASVNERYLCKVTSE